MAGKHFGEAISVSQQIYFMFPKTTVEKDLI